MNINIYYPTTNQQFLNLLRIKFIELSLHVSSFLFTLNSCYNFKPSKTALVSLFAESRRADQATFSHPHYNILRYFCIFISSSSSQLFLTKNQSWQLFGSDPGKLFICLWSGTESMTSEKMFTCSSVV